MVKEQTVCAKQRRDHFAQLALNGAEVTALVKQRQRTKYSYEGTFGLLNIRDHEGLMKRMIGSSTHSLTMSIWTTRCHHKSESGESEAILKQDDIFHFLVPKVFWKSLIWDLGLGILIGWPGSLKCPVLTVESLISPLQTYIIIRAEGRRNKIPPWAAMRTNRNR